MPYHRTIIRMLPVLSGILLWTGCSEQIPQVKEPSAPEAVSFDAYLNRGVDTRAGSPGILDGEKLGNAGFGVFAFNASAVPDFMYNTQVTNPGGAWTYAPVKYWPARDDDGGSHATVSFYAYAPYVQVNPDTGIPLADEDGTPVNSYSTGITRMSRRTDNGEPYVAYKSSFLPSESVDLCWSAPVMNAVRGDVSSKVKFNFKHALSALNVTVDAITDEVTDSPTTNPGSYDGCTNVYIRQVTFEGFAPRGTLTLDGTETPQWSGYGYEETLQRTPLTVHDGLLDGREAVYGDPGEAPVGLSAQLTQTEGVMAGGVDATTRNLFDGGVPSAPVFVIPNGYPLKITVVYDIETYDDKLHGPGAYLSDGVTPGLSKRVAISSAVTTASGPVRMEAGKKYVLRLHLGLTSVKFAAEIGITDKWSEDPHPANFEAVIVTGQDYYEYEVDDNWRE